MGLNLICQGMWVVRSCAVWSSERVFIGSQRLGNFSLASIFCWNWKNSLTAHSRIATTIDIWSHTPQVNQELPYWQNYEDQEGGKAGQDKDGVGTSVTVKVGEISEKTRDGKDRSMMNNLVVLYYLSHITSVRIISHFLWLVTVFSVVYRWWTLIGVSSETPIHALTILFCLYVSPPSSWCLMIVWKILSSSFNMEMGSGIVPPLRNNSPTFLPSWMRRGMSTPSSTTRSSLWILP